MANIVKANIANALNSLTGVVATTDQIVDPDTGVSIDETISVNKWNDGSIDTQMFATNFSLVAPTTYIIASPYGGEIDLTENDVYVSAPHSYMHFSNQRIDISLVDEIIALSQDDNGKLHIAFPDASTQIDITNHPSYTVSDLAKSLQIASMIDIPLVNVLVDNNDEYKMNVGSVVQPRAQSLLVSFPAITIDSEVVNFNNKEGECIISFQGNDNGSGDIYLPNYSSQIMFTNNTYDVSDLERALNFAQVIDFNDDFLTLGDKANNDVDVTAVGISSKKSIFIQSEHINICCSGASIKVDEHFGVPQTIIEGNAGCDFSKFYDDGYGVTNISSATSLRDELDSKGSVTATGLRVNEYGPDLSDALTAALATIDSNSPKITLLDCTMYSGNITISDTIVIDKPCTIQFGSCTITSTAANFFEIKSNNVTILGLGRQTDRNSNVSNSTTFILSGDTGSNAITNDSDKGYHIYSKGYKNLRFEYFTLKGKRTTLGRQCGNASYPIDGCGGIHIDKENPLETASGNTCNNIVINQLLIDGTKVHGIYIATPILTKISNVRLSQVAGHGVFLNGGTSVTLDNVYSASSNLAGFCILGVSYCTFLNTVAEYCPIAYLIRSSFNVSLFSPGCEETMNQTQNIWRDSQTITGKYGFNVQVSGTKNGIATTDIIPDVTSDLYNQFAGCPYVIVGGRGISLYTPFATGICRANNYKSNASEISQNRTALLRVLGNARNVFVNNIQGTNIKSSSTSIYSDIRLEVVGGSAPDGVEIVYNPEYSLITQSWTNVVTSSPNSYAPVYIAPSAKNVVVRNGGKFYTDINAHNTQEQFEVIDLRASDGNPSARNREEISILASGKPIKVIWNDGEFVEYSEIVTPHILSVGSDSGNSKELIQIVIPCTVSMLDDYHPTTPFVLKSKVFIISFDDGNVDAFDITTNSTT